MAQSLGCPANLSQQVLREIKLECLSIYKLIKRDLGKLVVETDQPSKVNRNLAIQTQ